MLPFTINLAPLLLTLVTSFGILMHDARVDRAFASSAPISGYVSNTENILRNDDHPHTETVIQNLRDATSGQPQLQTRFTDEKKYISPRKVFYNTTFDDLN
jgi:hypothetical protein